MISFMWFFIIFFLSLSLKSSLPPFPPMNRQKKCDKVVQCVAKHMGSKTGSIVECKWERELRWILCWSVKTSKGLKDRKAIPWKSHYRLVIVGANERNEKKKTTKF